MHSPKKTGRRKLSSFSSQSTVLIGYIYRIHGDVGWTGRVGTLLERTPTALRTELSKSDAL